MNNYQIKSNNSHIERILYYIENWKHEFFLNSRSGIPPPLIKNDDDKINWILKNPKKIEFTINYLTPSLQRDIKKALKKNYSVIIKPNIKKENQHILIIRQKESCVIS